MNRVYSRSRQIARARLLARRAIAKLEYGSDVRSSEWIAFLYFLYLAVVCWLRPLPTSRRLLVTCTSMAVAAAIGTMATSAPMVVRDWTPLLYVTVGYYLTGRLFVEPSAALESWLRGVGPQIAWRSDQAVQPLARMDCRVP